jgi:hypothetical protein
MSSVLGVHIGIDSLYAVVVERVAHGLEVVSYFERKRRDATDGTADIVAQLQDVIDEAGVKDVALTIESTDAIVRHLPNQERLTGRERNAAAKLLVETNHFDQQTKVRLFSHGDEGWYVAAARHDRVGYLIDIVTRAGGRLTWLDHEAYAWADVVPPEAQALVVVDAGAVKLVIPGRSTVEIGTYLTREFPPQGIDRSTERRIAEDILGKIIEAAQAQYADVDRVAVLDGRDEYMRQLRLLAPENTLDVVPFQFAGDDEDGNPVDRRHWALARSLAIRALQPRHARIAVNFTEQKSQSSELLARVSSMVRTYDAGVVAAGLAVAVALCGWQYTMTNQLTARVTAYQVALKSKQQEASLIQGELGRIATARSVLERVEKAQRSGPLEARQVASIVERINERTSASGLIASNGTWTLTGHAPDDSVVAQLLDGLRSTGYDSTLNSASQQGPRLTYAIELDAPTVAAAPGVPGGAAQ